MADWRVIGEYVYDEQGGRHQAWYTPVRDTWAMGQLVPVGERVFVERSVKFTSSDREKLWRDSGVVEAGRWTQGTEYGTLRLIFLLIFTSLFSLLHPEVLTGPV